MSVRVQAETFDPAQELDRFCVRTAGAGALASFAGYVRSSSQGDEITELRLEHYPGFTEAEIERIEANARARFDLMDALIIHRHGALKPGEPIVLAAALAAHRKAAIQAVDFIMDHLKTDAPFWKREATPNGVRWVEPRPEDRAARIQWEET
jgi:molybdopterin synthase catalytic subunit